MNESSTAQLPRACPVWCIDTPTPDHLAYDDDGDRLHKGPLFGGLLRGWGMESLTRPMKLSVGVEDTHRDFGTPAQLRNLAAAAEEAARWVESVR